MILVLFLHELGDITNKEKIKKTVDEEHEDVEVDAPERVPGVEGLNLVAGNVGGGDDLAGRDGDVPAADGVLRRH